MRLPHQRHAFDRPARRGDREPAQLPGLEHAVVEHGAEVMVQSPYRLRDQFELAAKVGDALDETMGFDERDRALIGAREVERRDPGIVARASAMEVGRPGRRSRCSTPRRPRDQRADHAARAARPSSLRRWGSERKSVRGDDSRARHRRSMILAAAAGHPAASAVRWRRRPPPQRALLRRGDSALSPSSAPIASLPASRDYSATSHPCGCVPIAMPDSRFRAIPPGGRSVRRGVSRGAETRPVHTARTAALCAPRRRPGARSYRRQPGCGALDLERGARVLRGGIPRLGR